MNNLNMFVYNCLVICSLFVTVFSKQCYWNNKNRYSYFATITPYDDVRGDIRDELPLEGCSPVSLWAMVRHGTRHPGPKDTKTMHRAVQFKETIISNYREGRLDMCAQDFTDLSNWRWDESLDSSQNDLTSEGYRELMHLGQRVREKFSPLLGNLDSVQLRPTKESRTKASAKAFVEGLQDFDFTIEEALEIDNVIRPYKHCDKYNKDINNDTRLEKERNRLYQTKEYKQMLANVRERTGISDLSRENVTAIYNLCKYYRAYTVDRRDPWCSLFDDRDLRVLEYVKDLTDYYSCGYASPTASKLGAFPLNNLLENLEASVNGSQRFTVYFSHDTMMAMTFTALGLFRDYPGISGLEIDPGRKWRASFATPFTANLIVVLNKCLTEDAVLHKVQMFVNEGAVSLCGERACAWADFRQKLLPFKDNSLEFCTV